MMVFCSFLLVLSFLPRSESGKGVKEEWLALAKGVKDHGGWVDERLSGNLTQHSGVDIRGIVVTKLIPENQVLFEIPDNVLFKLERFPSLQREPLADYAECKKASTHGNLDGIKVAAALALEAHKGETSKYHYWIKTLPTLDDYKAFHPRLMEPALQQDFNGLFLVEIAQAMQRTDESIRKCFEGWARRPSSPVAKLSWNDIFLALLRITTRAFKGRDAGIMIPAADVLNTPERSSKANIQAMTMLGVFTFATNRNVALNEELLFEYCSTCDNTVMLSKWGVYLEDNFKGNRGGSSHRATCNTTNNVSNSQVPVLALRRATEASLDVQSVSQAKNSKWTAPRCHPESLSGHQGPLRCSLARLSWELCVKEWGHGQNGGWSRSSRRLLPAADAASFLDNSFIQAVHPGLHENHSGNHRIGQFLKWRSGNAHVIMGS